MSTASTPPSSSHVESSVHIVLISTGGTIACTTDDAGGLIPTVTGATLASLLSSRQQPDAAAIEVCEFRQLDSSSISLSDLDQLRGVVTRQLARPEVAGILITHGTDSMEETAIALDIFHGDDKPIVLTGAQRAFDDPTGDGPTNLRDALALIRSLSSGVFIQFGGVSIRARGARKRHTSAPMAFEATAIAPAQPGVFPLAPACLSSHPVAIIAAYPGADATLVDAASAHFPGIVIEALGAGNMSTDMGNAVERALDRGVAVVIASRVPYGSTAALYGGQGGGASLHAKGAVSAGGFRAGQARILLSGALASGADVSQVFAPAD